MAYEGQQPLKLGEFTAAADLSGKQYYFVKLASATTVDVCSAVTDIPIGVLQNKPTSGQAAEVVTIGQTKISADANLGQGDLIATSSDGQAQTFTAGTDTTAYCVGRVITDPAAAGEIHTAIVNCVNPFRGIAGI
jgi:hypothetical protein